MLWQGAWHSLKATAIQSSLATSRGVLQINCNSLYSANATAATCMCADCHCTSVLACAKALMYHGAALRHRGCGEPPDAGCTDSPHSAIIANIARQQPCPRPDGEQPTVKTSPARPVHRRRSWRRRKRYEPARLADIPAHPPQPAAALQLWRRLRLRRIKPFSGAPPPPSSCVRRTVSATQQS